MDVVFVVGALVFFLLAVCAAVVSGRSGRRARSAGWSGVEYSGAWSDGWSGGDGGSSHGGGGDGGGGGGGCGSG